MSIAAHYNARPAGRGKKRGIISKILCAFFPVKGDGAGEIIRKIIFLGALSSFIYFGGSVVIDLANEFYHQAQYQAYIDRMNEVEIDRDVYDEVIAKVPEILPEFIAGYNENHDLVGHIRLEDKASNDYIINYPVYQADDNEYYLTHTSTHAKSEGGAIFADYRNAFLPGEISANTILYGHNIITGGYFAKLSRYYTSTDLEFYKSHPTLEFDTIYEKSKWKIFACVLFNTEKRYGEVYDYTNQLNFYTKEEFNNFVLDIMDRSVLFTDVDLEYGDNIITLSTCYYPYGKSVDTRCVIFARKVRKGENENVDVNKAVYNTRELRFEEQAKRIGTNWNGRVWDTSYLKS